MKSNLLILTGIIASLTFAPAQTTNTAPAAPLPPRTETSASTVPDPSTMLPRGIRREGQIRAAIAGHQPQLILVGDSITEFYNKDVLARNYGRYDVCTFGFSGENTEHLLGHLSHGVLDGMDPKVAILLIGTNNLGHHQDEKPEWVAAGIKAVVAELHRRLPHAKVLVMGIFPRGRLPNDPIRARVTAVNVIVAGLDDGQGTRFIDIGAKFLLPDGSLNRELLGDWLHPTPKGEQVWADSIQPLLDEMMK